MSEPSAQLRALRGQVRTNEVKLTSLRSDVDKIDERVKRIEVVLASLLQEFAHDRDTTVDDLAGEEGVALLDHVNEIKTPVAEHTVPDSDSASSGGSDGDDDEHIRHL